jgi:hypothetical protein
MKELKNSSFAERQALSNQSKKDMLAKFKFKATVVDPNIEERRLAEQLKLEEIREARRAEREAKRAVSAEAEDLRREMETIQREADEVSLRSKQKAARDARYAARKQKRN